jgi:hypothetical protein
MQSSAKRRALLLSALALTTLALLILLARARTPNHAAHPRDLPTACADSPPALLVAYPSPATSDPTLLSLNLPAPILIEPTPCP